MSGKIHNYFFAKGLDKLSDGGLLAYITTDGFLNNPSNQTAREYAFNKADFISLTVMPDNLMKETGNTEAPSHLLIVQKNETKQHLSTEEKSLIDTVEKKNEFGNYHLNKYINEHPEIITGDEIKAGKNQYGNANQTVWQHGDINNIAEKLSSIISDGIKKRFSKSLYQQAQLPSISQPELIRKKLTFLPMPENKAEKVNVQLGLFDSIPPENINRAMAYINELDETVVQKQTARIISMVRTTEKPEHESIVLVTAKAPAFKQYVYKLYSNVEEVSFPVNWQSAAAINHEIRSLSNKLPQFGHAYTYEGDRLLQAAFGLEHSQRQQFTSLKPFYKEGTLVIHNGIVGSIGKPDIDFSQATFQPFLSGQHQKDLYENYITIRDSYLELAEKESAEDVEYAGLRKILQDSYEKFIDQYGLLNYPSNRKLISNDSAFGFTILSSLERKEGDRFVQADIITKALHHKEEQFRTDNPIEALAQCLNENGKVNIDFIQSSTGLSEFEIFNRLEGHIYINPQSNEWETVDQYLSGNVVEKLKTAKEQADLHPENVQFKKSHNAIIKVQPEKIPFELLDFNLGERWIPIAFYDRFATNLFELNT
ncbi:MAG: hypothetical protein M3015_01395 [Bacteroidota bacterium]|nr:hypothetical protein [Bacteroidota bacterium]